MTPIFHNGATKRHPKTPAHRFAASAFACLLVLIICFSLMGPFVTFKIKQHQVQREIKHRIKAGIPQQELHPFAWPVSMIPSIDWVRQGKEFRYQGEMYDVVTAETVGDTIIYQCVNDKEEKILFGQLSEMVKREMSSEPDSPAKPAKKTIKLVKNLVYTLPLIHSSYLSYHNPHSLSQGWVDFYLPPILEASSPPPWFV